MNNNTAALALPTKSHLPQLDAILANKPNMSPKTAYRYRRAVERAEENGVNVLDVNQASAWGNSLTTSNRSFFKAGLKLLGDALAIQIKTNATPENIASSQAALMRIDAMTSGIESVKNKGTKAHMWLTRAQVKALLESPDTSTLKGKRDFIVLALAVGAGLRRNEITDLKWDAIKTQGERVVLEVTGKGSKTRVIPINSDLAAVLSLWKAITGADGYIARSINKGGAFGDSLSGVGVLDIVAGHGMAVGMVETKEVYDRASKRRINKEVGTLQPHDLRRTYAQIGYESGVPIAQISKLLGHSNIATTEKYLNITLDTKETISDFIPFSSKAW